MATLVRADFDQNGAVGYYEMGGAGLAFESPEGPPPGVALAIGAAPSLTALPTQGYAHGAIIFQAQRFSPNNFSSGSDAYGIVCLASDPNFSTTGTGYLLEYHPTNGNLVLYKFHAGFASNTVLDSRTLGIGPDRELRLVWLVDPYNADWVFFRVFASGALQYRYQDFFAPLYVSGVTEGFGLHMSSGLHFGVSFTSAALYAEL